MNLIKWKSSIIITKIINKNREYKYIKFIIINYIIFYLLLLIYLFHNYYQIKSILLLFFFAILGWGISN